MRKGIWLAAGVVFFAVPCASWAQQQAAQTSPSQSAAQTKSEKSGTQATAKSDPLVQAARQAREARKETPTHSVVFTNDNMPTSATAISIVGNASASAESSASVRAREAQDAKSDEKLWRQKFANARSTLREDKDKLGILKSNFNALGRMRYFNETDAINKQQAMLDQEKKVEADQKAIDDLTDALRKAGGDPAWGR